MMTEEHKDRLNITEMQAHYWRTQLDRHNDELSRKMVRVFEPLLLGLGTLLAKSMEEDKDKQSLKEALDATEEMRKKQQALANAA